MPRLSSRQLAALRARVYHDDAIALLDAFRAASLPADLVTLKQAAAVTGQTLTYLRKRLRAKTIHQWRVGSRIVISLGELIQVHDPKRKSL